MYTSILFNSCKKLQENKLINYDKYIECQKILKEPNATWGDNTIEKDDYDKLLDKINNNEIVDYKVEIENLQKNDSIEFGNEMEQKIKEVKRLQKELDKYNDKTLFITKKKLIAENHFIRSKYSVILYCIFIVIIILIIIYYTI